MSGDAPALYGACLHGGGILQLTPPPPALLFLKSPAAGADWPRGVGGGARPHCLGPAAGRRGGRTGPPWPAGPGLGLPRVAGREAWTGSDSDSREKRGQIPGRIPGTNPAPSATSPGAPPYSRTPRPAWPRSPNRPHLCCSGSPGHAPRVSILTQPDPVLRPCAPRPARQ